MSATFFCALESLGPGDLLQFRDAAVTYAACRRQGQTLRRQASSEGYRLLDWLGLEGEAGEPAGVAYLDPSRQPAGSLEVHRLPDGKALEGLSLNLFRRQGLLPEALFSALIRSSYGSASPDFFPTRSELGFYFDEALLLSEPARWDEEYLRDCQTFFMEELTPAELVEKSLLCLDWEQGQALAQPAERFAEQLHGVTFLVAAELQTVKPLAELLQGLLSREVAAPGLPELLAASGPNPSRGDWKAAWDGLGVGQQALASALCPSFSEQAEDLLFTAGGELLRWRAEREPEVAF